jgi:hypothetical protein
MPEDSEDSWCSETLLELQQLFTGQFDQPLVAEGTTQTLTSACTFS